MISTTQTLQIKSLETCFDAEGLQISFGLAEIYSYGNGEPNIDEIPFRAKGQPALAINKAGIGAKGCAQGYIDVAVQPREEYKEKIYSLVIRNFKAEEGSVQQAIPVPTPDFAKELLNSNLPDEDEESEIPF
ncbi:MAG: hypothetical protein KME64_41280 [Scytonematopsis contorta HA4267-MV1]|jgi:hypothetical protein|nr:hypothetical protein [Scytonematopsis contorta HA4267-MV1]